MEAFLLQKRVNGCYADRAVGIHSPSNNHDFRTALGADSRASLTRWKIGKPTSALPIMRGRVPRAGRAVRARNGGENAHFFGHRVAAVSPRPPAVQLLDTFNVHGFIAPQRLQEEVVSQILLNGYFR